MSSSSRIRGPLRVLHCPQTVAGNAQQLARAEREIGLNSWAIGLHPHPFGYPSDEFLLSEPAPSIVAQMRARARLLVRAVRHADIVHLNFGDTLFPGDWVLDPVVGGRHWARRVTYRALRPALGAMVYRDLQLLRALGKRIAVTFQGDDARQGDYCREHFAITAATEVDYYSPAVDALKRIRVSAFDRYADRIYSLNPDLLHVLPDRAEFLPYAQIDLRQWQVVPGEGNPVPVIVHAPSHRGVKGTRFLLSAIERLRAEGVPFEFRLVENMSHADARAQYERADLLVDQLLLGWYGGLAVELMALGKPVICYVRDGDLHRLPQEMRAMLPVINATPDSIFDVLKYWLLEPRSRWREIGAQSREYVERWHDPISIARRLAVDYDAMMRADVGTT